MAAPGRLPDERRFFMDGPRQLVRELDGTVHEADPHDPDLLALRARIDKWLETAEIEPQEVVRAGLFAAAKEYRDAEWALRILDGEGCNRLDPRWNAAVERWRAADAALVAALGDTSPFR